MEVWTPTIGVILLVKSEPTNYQDSEAVAILKENVTVGHFPQNIAPRFRFYGPPTYIRRMEALILSLRHAGHL